MFDLSNLLLFAVAGLALNLTPGPDMLYCATRAASQGKAAGVLSAVGGGVGGLVHTIAAAFGLSALLTYSATAFMVVKYAGVFKYKKNKIKLEQMEMEINNYCRNCSFMNVCLSRN